MTTEQKCECPVPLKPMKDWVEEADPAVCRPCALGPILSWYVSELQEQGYQEHADKLTGLVESAGPSEICGTMDSIKDEVAEPTRERLREFDCAVQSFKPDEAAD